MENPRSGEANPSAIRRALRVEYDDVEAAPLEFANVFLTHADSAGLTFLTYGRATPPAIYGSREEQEQKVAQITHVRARTLGRLVFTRSTLKELIQILSAHDAALEQLDK